MWLQLRLALLIGLMTALIYSFLTIIVAITQGTGQGFYLIMLPIALLIAFFQYLIGPSVVERSMKVVYIDASDHPRLYRMVEELATHADLPMPRVCISKLKIPNAFAFGRTKKDSRVCVTQGLLDLLDDKELKAVLGHELSHIKHHDVAIITVLSVIPLVCYMIYYTMFWGSIFGGSRDNKAILFAIALLALLVYAISSLLVAYGSRIREYYADKGSIELGSQPKDLATALYKLSLSSAQLNKKTLKQAEGMKAFFLNDPTRAREEIYDLQDLDLDMSGTLDANELYQLKEKSIQLGPTDKLMELLSTHPNMIKRIKQLAEMQD